MRLIISIGVDTCWMFCNNTCNFKYIIKPGYYNMYYMYDMYLYYDNAYIYIYSFMCFDCMCIRYNYV